MAENVPAVPSKLKALWRIVKGAGPLLLTQSEKLSENYAKHQLRLAEVEAHKTMMVEEAKAIVDIRKRLIERYMEAPADERIRLRRDIADAEREIRQLTIYQKALDHIPEGNEQSPEEKLDAPEEFKVWLDAFNDYARKLNEPWRTDLLARALALEAAEPGSVGQRALWFIGTVDASTFHAFAVLLDLCSNFAGNLLIPNHNHVSKDALGNETIGPQLALGNFIFTLDPLGLFGNVLSTQSTFPENVAFATNYGDRVVILKTKNEQLVVGGVILTSLGRTLAELYDRKHHPLGAKAYETWLSGLGDTVEVIADSAKSNNAQTPHAS